MAQELLLHHAVKERAHALLGELLVRIGEAYDTIPHDVVEQRDVDQVCNAKDLPLDSKRADRDGVRREYAFNFP